MYTKLEKSGINYLIRVAFQIIIGAILFFVSSGTLKNHRGWVYFIVYAISTVLGVLYLSKHNPEVLNERAKERNNTEQWDNILLKIYVALAFFVIYIIAGFDIRFGWSSISVLCMYPALAIVILSSLFAIWAMKENTNFEATSRIQSDRIQNICESGPYKIVRHPGYLAIILWAVAIPFVFGSIYMMIPSFLISVIIVIRTYLEDEMLKKKLVGYVEYSNGTKYRLIPYIW
ncbi:isoprenylcysteine carboxylmethyltransferase family protein [Proteiniborus sp. MB09-C3]|uniref:methyltransferase family protein n=1 Tax=Proteiniborus sp. MB09-C3 TaxID=3050072 RepID=UPI00255611DF|nr:isoprenylcysteine carboxylmethyltransferase family protein [Proteiniborus sp. MB09-C3]WIV12730.1 isoprenylcysteine carboxylmethyltransferase family protein [Proteiniborus sp. MB09-C3]